MITKRHVGLGLMILAVLLFGIGYTYIRSAEAALLAGHVVSANGTCTHDEAAVCPFAQLNELSGPKHIALILDILLFGFGLFLFLFPSEEKVPVKTGRPKIKPNLAGEEAKVYDLIFASEGMMYQNDLVVKTGLSKVKVTRILDKLEAKGHVERRRRGMTNVVILK